MKILIADDERMVRFSVQSMLEELYPGRFSFAHAENGRVLLAKAESFQPDIAFVDIQMPLMSGLEALAECQRLSPGTAWVILSGFATFAYAKTALQLGAQEYLLKPPSLDELKATVDTALERCIARAHDENERFSLAVMRRFSHYEILPDEPEPDGDKGFYELCLFYADQQQHTLRQASLKACTGALQQELDSQLAQEAAFRYALFNMAGGELCLVAKHVSDMRTLRDTVVRCLRGHSITAMRTQASNLSALCAASAAIRAGAPLRCLHGFGGLIDVQSPVWQQLQAAGLPTALKLEEACLAFMQRDELAYKSHLDAFNALCTPGLWQLASLDALNGYLGTVLGKSPNAKTPGALCEWLAGLVQQMYRAKEVTPDLTEKVRQYVQQHYAEPIGVATLAEMYDISPNYLSRIFHEKCGVKFIDYLTEVRISNAKRLFAETPGITVKAVSEQVGYYGTRHFTKTFQRLTGVLPSEYSGSLVE